MFDVEADGCNSGGRSAAVTERRRLSELPTKFSEWLVNGLGRRMGESAGRVGEEDRRIGCDFELENTAGENEGVTKGDTGARTGCRLPAGSKDELTRLA
jgi:hypothetical protein